ncbi:carotenoid biosynthesis protein [Aestuariivirga sp.]|jgi:putative membrane protein|uniref:carotenoid biosynthesis protein n=1 Tax=Aestuariivirga sp. TaxID=2650926 RepID=UPI0037830D35
MANVTLNTTGTDKTETTYLGLYWSLLAIYVAVSIPLFLMVPNKQIIALMVTALIIAFAHGSQRYGLKSMIVFFLMVNVVGFFFENLSVSTGFPFGNYHYTNALNMPMIWQVPLDVALLYFAMGYISWTIANTLLDKADERLGIRFNLFALPVVSAFLMTSWDVVFDPTWSTHFQTWIWEDGGGFFGVPLSNYLGWYFVTWIFFQGFALYLSKNQGAVRPTGLPETSGYWMVTIVLYLLVAGGYAMNYFVLPDEQISDATGNVWRSKDIDESAVIVAIYTMGFGAVLAVLRLMQPRVASQDA